MPKSSPEAGAGQLSPVTQDYLKVLWNLGEWSEAPVTTKLLAEKLGVSASTASEGVRKLVDQGLVEHERYGSVSLTQDGRAAAVSVVRRHRLIETFLVEELHYGWDEVHDEAEILEHAISDRFVERLDAKLGRPARDPHGDPIPRQDGSVPAQDASKLADAPEGTDALIARISDHDPEMLRYFESVGLALDAQVSVLRRRDFAGTITIRLDDQGSNAIELGKPAAEAVWIVPKG
ncbi:iron (metal) dependent repressor, DtxR family [Segniliparus rotundus DSM 44985]|uniref:Manganese transport regulator n=1 Tax=Segniliparus rotundus (strain ATCC BAA-972 / CDC 1076 / CIP 108378 / DSM 44985 / JCM 13578) TaxID=640132 RepID=D6Z7T2_SEGRD|nr:metal-dependent transcriptional regulator [Segniliparus rotundus]ADG98012.1 iron (metal) dependent repressor, DtxR family [Segniliparus rotundus DSM 44985]